MATEAGLVPGTEPIGGRVVAHPEAELVVRPRLGGTRVVRLLMHPMAGAAGQLPALEARAPHDALILASPDAHPAVRPEARLGRARVVRVRFDAGDEELVSGAVVLALAEPARPVGERLDGVALTADLRGAQRGEPCGVGDRVGVTVAEVQREPANRIPVGEHVLLPGTVTGFAGDPELGDPGIWRLPADLARLAVGRVTEDAELVPLPALLVLRVVGGREHEIVEGEPALLGDLVHHRKEPELLPVTGLEPVRLEVVRARRHHDAPPLGPVLADPERAVLLAEAQLLAVDPELDAVERRDHGLRARELRHPAVIGPMPARPLRRMAGAARV